MTLQEIQKTLKAPKNQYNSFGKYNYRNCEDILEAVKPLLGDSVLTLSDEVVVLGGNNPTTYNTPDSKNNTVVVPMGEQRFYIKATAIIICADKVFSASGYARETVNKKGMDESQITGSASSYARKYALNGLFLIDDNKDADSRDNSTVTLNLNDKRSTIQDRFNALLDGLPMASVLEWEAKWKTAASDDERIQTGKDLAAYKKGLS